MTDMEVPKKAGNGVKRLGDHLGRFPESFINIRHLEPNQDSWCPLSPSWSLGGHGGS